MVRLMVVYDMLEYHLWMTHFNKLASFPPTWFQTSELLDHFTSRLTSHTCSHWRFLNSFKDWCMESPRAGHRNWPKNLRLSIDITIHWKALEEHFVMVALVFWFNHLGVGMHILNFSHKTSVLNHFAAHTPQPVYALNPPKCAYTVQSVLVFLL
jgi:hypothetical protein